MPYAWIEAGLFVLACAVAGALLGAMVVAVRRG